MLCINYFSSLASGQVFLPGLNIQPDNVQITRQAYGGNWSLTHSFNCSQRTAESWLEEGIGRHVELYSPGTMKIWDGFVDQIDINIGSLTKRRGSLIDTVANRIWVAFSTVDTSTDPPTVGIRDFTTAANDTTSQGKYGIIERVISVGEASLASAEQMRDTAIIEHAEPDSDEADNLTSSTSPSVSITCLGYHHWLKAYTVDLTTTGDQNASAKIQAVLAADPNSFFSTNYNYVIANTVQVGADDQDRRIADGVIKGITALGGTSNERWVFGFANDRIAYYKAIPTIPFYQRRLAEPEQRVEQWVSGQRIKPWNVQAGEWIFYSDLFVGKSSSTALATDPRYMFIEQAQYSTPWNLALQGSQVGNLDQIMAQKGLGGTVA